MGGDKIVLLDGAGANGGGAATNGLLSMIPGMFANLIGGNKMDPNLVAALMNGRNNQDGFGGAGAIVKNMIPAFPFFPFGKKGIKILYRSAGNRIPVAGLFHITFLGYEYST